MKKLAQEIRNYVSMTKEAQTATKALDLLKQSPKLLSNVLLGTPWAQPETIRGMPSTLRVNREMLTRALGALAGGVTGAAAGGSLGMSTTDSEAVAALAAITGGLGGAALGSRGAGALRGTSDAYRRARSNVTNLDKLDPALVDEMFGVGSALRAHLGQASTNLGALIPR